MSKPTLKPKLALVITCPCCKKRVEIPVDELPDELKSKKEIEYVPYRPWPWGPYTIWTGTTDPEEIITWEDGSTVSFNPDHDALFLCDKN